MFAHAHAPENLDPSELDEYLQRGWFRMGQTIFTTNFLNFKSRFYSAIWLRMLLDKFSEDNTQRKLFKRNSIFRTHISPATLTAEKEELYTRYRITLPFQPSETLEQLLFGKLTGRSLYNTYEVTVSDGDQLIAFGLFDLGATSAAGITSVYDPAYKKFSLGKYIIYQKLNFCKARKMDCFYPGYFVPGYPYFDYKLTMGRSALQFLQLQSNQWLPIEQFSTDSIPYEVMLTKLKAVQKLLTLDGPEAKVVKYEFFDANLVPELREAELFDFPLILWCFQAKDGINPIVVFDVRDGQYHVLKCAPVWKPENPNPDPEFYSAYLLKPMEEIYATVEAVEIADLVAKFDSRSV